jgi:hypothetical protein
MAHFMPCDKTITGEETARFFIDYIYKYHGLPDDIISKCGSLFTSKFWQSLFKILKVKIKLSSVYHSQTNGQIERVNQILEQYLRCTSTRRKPSPYWHKLTQFPMWYNTFWHKCFWTLVRQSCFLEYRRLLTP